MSARVARPLIAAMLAATPLLSCHRPADDAAAAGGDEARQLNAAAAALDAQGNATDGNAS